MESGRQVRDRGHGRVLADGRDLQVILRSLTAFGVVLKRQAGIAAPHRQGVVAALSPLSFGRRVVRNAGCVLKCSRKPCFQGRIGTGMMGRATFSGPYACSPMQHCEHRR